MSFDVKLQINKSENNKIDKSLTDISTYSGVLKNDTDIINPIIQIECSLSDVKHTNYMTISSFGRSYFILNIRSLNNRVVEFQCHVDVLTSFKNEIKANQGIIKRSESKSVYNLYLNDGSFKIYQNPKMMLKEFPNGFTDYEYVLAVAGM